MDFHNALIQRVLGRVTKDLTVISKRDTSLLEATCVPCWGLGFFQRIRRAFGNRKGSQAIFTSDCFCGRAVVICQSKFSTSKRLTVLIHLVNLHLTGCSRPVSLIISKQRLNESGNEYQAVLIGLRSVCINNRHNRGHIAVDIKSDIASWC